MQALKHLKRVVTDWFLCGMFLATFLAWLFPDVGRSGGAMHAEYLINGGVFLVFFLHGINLSSEQIGRGLKNGRLHLMVQGFTFVVFPLLWWLADKLLGSHVPALLMLGFFYLCALPSTISSSVALTGSAGGNVPAAILNASLSSVLGIFITPWLVSLVVGTGSNGIDLGATLLDLCALLLLPLVLGQLLRPLAGALLRPAQALHQHPRQTGDPAAGLCRLLQLDGFGHVAAARQCSIDYRVYRQCAVAGADSLDDHPHCPGPAFEPGR